MRYTTRPGDRSMWNEVEEAERVLRRSGKVIA